MVYRVAAVFICFLKKGWAETKYKHYIFKLIEEKIQLYDILDFYCNEVKKSYHYIIHVFFIQNTAT